VLADYVQNTDYVCLILEINEKVMMILDTQIGSLLASQAVMCRHKGLELRIKLCID